MNVMMSDEDFQSKSGVHASLCCAIVFEQRPEQNTAYILWRNDDYLRAIIKQLCAIAALQQERLSLGDIRQLLAESVNLKKINKATNERTNETTNDGEHSSITLFK